MICFMKPIRTPFFFLLTVWILIVFANQCNAKDLSTQELASLIRPIEPYAMQYGSGNITAYVFIDPKCPHSRDFISMLYENEKMRGIYHYYIFFYELKRFKSHKLIGTIYTSPTPLQKTLEVMVGGKKMDEMKSLSAKVNEQIGAIEQVAKTIGIKKRPYLIIAKEWN